MKAKPAVRVAPRVRLRLGLWVRVRVVGVAVVITALMAGIAYRAWALQIRDVDTYRELARRQHVATVEVPAPRGAIYDATGTELAATANVDSVYVNPHAVRDLTATAERLSALLGLDEREMEARLASPRYFAWIARHVDPADARAVRDAHLRGVYLTPEPRRFYPGRELAGPVLGFADIDGHGLDGVELTMNDLLTGKKASEAALRDATGKVMLPDARAARPVPGAAVTLTIDRTIQFIAETALERTVTRTRAHAGVAVVLDVKTGDVLAMASRPTYDPNRPGETRKGGARNRAVTDVFEIGSVMKVFSVSSALDAGVVTPDTKIKVAGGLRIGHKLITDVDHDDVLTVSGVVKRSSNVGAGKIAGKLGKQALHDALARFGFGRQDRDRAARRAARGAARRRPLERRRAGHGFVRLRPFGHPAPGRGRIRRPGRPRRVPPASHRARGARRAGPGAVPAHRERTARHQREDRARDAVDHGVGVRGRARARHGRQPGPGGLQGRRQDRHRLQVRSGGRPLRQGHVYLELRRLRAARPPAGGGAGGGGRARPGHALRGGGGGPGLARHHDPRRCATWATPRAVTSRSGAGPRRSRPGRARRWRARQRRARGTAQVSGRAAADGGGDDDGAGVVLQPAESPGRVEIPDFRGMGMTRALELAARRGIEVEVSGSGKAVHQFPPPGPARKPAECRIVFEPPHELAVPARSPDRP